MLSLALNIISNVIFFRKDIFQRTLLQKVEKMVTNYKSNLSMLNVLINKKLFNLTADFI
jgi:hypothetical protein